MKEIAVFTSILPTPNLLCSDETASHRIQCSRPVPPIKTPPIKVLLCALIRAQYACFCAILRPRIASKSGIGPNSGITCSASNIQGAMSLCPAKVI